MISFQSVNAGNQIFVLLVFVDKWAIQAILLFLAVVMVWNSTNGVVHGFCDAAVLEGGFDGFTPWNWQFLFCII
jgi:hypothetical protein